MSRWSALSMLLWTSTSGRQCSTGCRPLRPAVPKLRLRIDVRATLLGPQDLSKPVLFVRRVYRKIGSASFGTTRKSFVVGWGKLLIRELGLGSGDFSRLSRRKLTMVTDTMHHNPEFGR